MKKVLVVALVAVSVMAIAGCGKVSTEADNAKLDANGQPIQVTQATPSSAALINIAIGDAVFASEIAQSDEERATGLMNRESLPEKNGMWFVFPQMVNEKFWMKDTLIPLDLIFVDYDATTKAMKVVHTIENAQPKSTDILSSPVDYQYVLEVNGGLVAKHGIKVGDAVTTKVGS